MITFEIAATSSLSNKSFLYDVITKLMENKFSLEFSLNSSNGIKMNYKLVNIIRYAMVVFLNNIVMQF